MLVLGIVISVLGLGQVLDEQGIDLDLQALLVLSAVVGMTGSVVSLAMSKFMAKRMTNAQVIEVAHTEQEEWLFKTVQRQAQAAGIGMPEVAIYDAPDMNAFATGMFRNSALVAVSTGLLAAMKRDEVEAVLAHEVSHVANGDMITLALIQGVVIHLSSSCRASWVMSLIGWSLKPSVGTAPPTGLQPLSRRSYSAFSPVRLSCGLVGSGSSALMLVVRILPGVKRWWAP